ncbi:MAG: hypothetical protein COT85_05060 [Chlamydiae bacterium CG10_big_fil_rev_8_21_14_0_10_42_34]|nr:MAG: hypothetical protein COT85_05060 [Chlamydiae bacterium CG10_big_fil_rev_8_21_14_0_10_42_34]
MSHQWSPEKTIEPPEALKLIQDQFPKLNAQHIFLLGAGWDNTAFLIDDAYIFRFPRRKIALPFLEAERTLLPLLAERLPLPVPIPKWYGVSQGDYPWPFLGYKMLDGFTACRANLTEKQRFDLAVPIAKFLRKLHEMPQEIISKCLIENDNMSRVNVDVLAPKIEKNLFELKQLGLIDEIKVIKGAFRPPVATTVVHGDFYVRHLLVDSQHQLCGVIDWGDIHLGDPAIDLSIAHSFLPKEAHDLFKKAYGGIDEKTWALAKVRALFSSSLMAVYGYHNQDPDIVREALRSIAEIAF